MAGTGIQGNDLFEPHCCSVHQGMGEVSGTYVAGALIPAVILSVLFFFDHNVSSQMAQLEEFNLTKPSAYHYDLALLAFMVRDQWSASGLTFISSWVYTGRGARLSRACTCWHDVGH